MGERTGSERGHLTTGSTTNWKNALEERLRGQLPFSLLPAADLDLWIEQSQRVRYEIGQQLLRNDELNSEIILVLRGEVR